MPPHEAIDFRLPIDAVPRQSDHPSSRANTLQNLDASQKRFSWLLSASVAAGLAIADCYNLINVASAASAAVLVTFIAILRLVVRLAVRGSNRILR